MNINNYFDKIYLLNLHRRKDRLNLSMDKINKVGLNVEVFGGTDGTVLNYVLGKLGNSYFSNPSYLGCVISHLSIYKDAVVNGYERILILEDDNLIHSNINSIFDSLEIPSWTDLFYLGYIPLNDDLSMWTYGITMKEHQLLTDKIFRCNNLWGLYSYGITNSLMKECLDIYHNDFPMELDRFFVNHIQNRGGSIAIAPQLFCCDSDIYSDNQGYAPGISLTTKSVDTRYAKIEEYI